MEEASESNISSDLNGPILEVKISGDASKTSAKKIATEISGLVVKNKPKAVLIDVRSLKGRFELGDLYYGVRDLPRGVPILDTAVVGLKEYEEFDSFLEITSQNVGLPTQWFTEIEAARAWLKSRLVDK